MQRKRHINFKDFLSTSGSLLNLGQRIRKCNLHSIPTLLLHHQNSSDRQMKNKSNVLYSIPCVKSCACTFCILLVLGLLSMVIGSKSCYAATETFGDSSASLTLDTSDVEVAVAPGETGYASKDIKLSINNVNDYALTITAPATLSREGSGDSASAANATSWGYAYGQSGNLDAMTYTNFTGSAQTLESSTTSITNVTSTKTLALAAKFDNANEPGHYKADILLSLVATPQLTATYNITYNSNGGTGAPSSTTCTAQGAAGSSCITTLSSSKPTRSGYTFLGWSTSSTATSASYQPGGSITISKDTTLYAVWKDIRTMGSITYMQDMTSNVCANTTTGTTYTLKDSRDNNSYTVRKFADGKCWMTSNLIIVDKNLSSSDSDLDSGEFTIPASSMANFGYSMSDTDGNAPHAFVVGNTGYYNWYTATAGYGTSSVTSGSVNQSICPKNWKLPSGGSGGEYDMLASAENITDSASGSTTIRSEPYNFANTGLVISGSRSNTNYGYYWSNTAYGGSDAFFMFIRSSNVYPGTYNFGRQYGYAIRCVAR